MPTVAYTSPFVPPELIAACGWTPSRVVPAPGAAARSGMPVAGVCPFARAFVGEVRSGDDIDAVVVTSTCDQMRRSAEFLGSVPAFLMNVPATWQTPATIKLYSEELGRLGRFLADRGGRVPSDGELADAMESFDARPAGVKSDADASPKGVPVAVIGGPLMRGAAAPTTAAEPGDETPETGWLFDAVENAGGRVVLDATEGGERTLPAPFDRRRMRNEPLMVLVEAYFGRIPDAFRRPDSMLYDWLVREVPTSGARGVILCH